MPSPSPLVVGVRSQDTKSVCILHRGYRRFSYSAGSDVGTAYCRLLAIETVYIGFEGFGGFHGGTSVVLLW